MNEYINLAAAWREFYACSAGYYGPGYVDGPVGRAAGMIGTAGAIATAPFADSYAYYGDEPGYW